MTHIPGLPLFETYPRAAGWRDNTTSRDAAMAVREVLDCNFTDGSMVWKERPLEMFGSLSLCRMWNARYANTKALAYLNAQGYFCGSVFGKPYLAHRVVWALKYGEWPVQIDHINGIRTDNRIENMRSVSLEENTRNRNLPETNSSGVMGVHWCAKDRRWIAAIGRGDGTKRYLGCFAEKNDAINARRTAEIELGYHQNHGRS